MMRTKTKSQVRRKLFVSSDKENEPGPSTKEPISLARKRTKKRRSRTYNTYIYKVLRQLDDNAGLTRESVEVLDSFTKDMVDRISEEATHLCQYSGRRTIGEREVETAIQILLPGQLATHAINEGRKAVNHFIETNQN